MVEKSVRQGQNCGDDRRDPRGTESADQIRHRWLNEIACRVVRISAAEAHIHGGDAVDAAELEDALEPLDDVGGVGAEAGRSDVAVDGARETREDLYRDDARFPRHPCLVRAWHGPAGGNSGDMRAVVAPDHSSAVQRRVRVRRRTDTSGAERYLIAFLVVG